MPAMRSFSGEWRSMKDGKRRGCPCGASERSRDSETTRAKRARIAGEDNFWNAMLKA